MLYIAPQRRLLTVYGLTWLLALGLFLYKQVYSQPLPMIGLFYQHLTNFMLSYVLVLGFGVCLVSRSGRRWLPYLAISLILANLLAESVLTGGTVGDYRDLLAGLLGTGLAYLALINLSKR